MKIDSIAPFTNPRGTFMATNLVFMKLDGETVPSLVSLDERAMVTLLVGWALRTTVNVAVPPASVVMRMQPSRGSHALMAALELMRVAWLVWYSGKRVTR